MAKTNTAEIFKSWDSPTRLIIKPYEIGTNYFEFINKQKKYRMNPLTVTSQLMILILQYFVIDKGFKINKIALTDNDQDLKETLHYLIVKSNGDRSHLFFGALLNKLRNLDSKDYDYIEILKIEIRSKKRIISFQNDGLISANDSYFIKNSTKTSKFFSHLLKNSGNYNV